MENKGVTVTLSKEQVDNLCARVCDKCSQGLKYDPWGNHIAKDVSVLHYACDAYFIRQALGLVK